MRALAKQCGTVDDGLEKACAAVVKRALEGDEWAFTEMSNRIDGKPATIIVGDDDQPPVRFARIVRVIRKP